ncbi:MAG: hypothetical protein PHP88_03030 [bacterium]|nr:hypothetical protein [bacterium]
MEEERRKKKGRSPSYPAISLKAAIEKASMLYQKEGRHATPTGTAMSDMGYSTTSGAGIVALAALKKFGLIEDEGSGMDRVVKLTDLALDIILGPDDDSMGKIKAIQHAAMIPPIHSELWKEFEGSLPSPANLRHNLIRKRNFTDSGANDFIRQFSETIAFARLSESAIISTDASDSGGSKGTMTTYTPKIDVSTSTPLSRALSSYVNVNEEKFTLDEGVVEIRYPNLLSIDSIDEFEARFNQLIKRARRNAAKMEGVNALFKSKEPDEDP